MALVQTARILALVTLLVVDAVAAPSAVAQSETRADLPRLVGARVRVLAPRLGEGWHVGMFNRLRVEPPCYRVLLFAATGSIRRIDATLSPRDLTRIEVSTLGNGRARSYEPNEELDSKDDWRELPLDALGEAERRCPVADAAPQLQR
jgi:hypothetical protein